MRNLTTFMLVLSSIITIAQPYDDSQYYNDQTAGLIYNGHVVLPLNTWIIDVASAVQNGETDVYAYFVDDGSNIPQTIGIVSYSTTNGVETGGIDFWSGEEMIFASQFNNFIFGQDIKSSNFLANPGIATFATTSLGHFGPSSGSASTWDLITFVPNDIGFVSGGNVVAYGEYTVRYVYGLCNQNYDGTYDGTNWTYTCPGTETQGTLDIHLVWISPNEQDGINFSVDICADAPDITGLYPDSRAFEFSDIDVVPSGTYNTSTNTLDVSSLDAGTITLVQDWSIASRYVPYRTSTYNNTIGYSPGNVLALPTVTSASEFITCENTGTVTLPNGTPGGGVWSGLHVVGGDSWNTDGNGTGSWLAAYTYTDGNGCSNTTNMTVTVDPRPNLITSTDVTICPGEETTLTVSGADLYTWSPATGLSATAGNTVKASPTTTTTFTINSISESGCEAVGQITVTVRTPYGTQAQAATIELCEGIQTQLDVTGATAGLSYSWSPASRVSNNLIRNPTTNINSSTTFQLDVTTPDGCIETSNVTIFVENPPEADAGNDREVCSGVNLQLNGNSSTGIGTIAYSWTGTGIVGGANTPTPTINTTVDHLYTLTITDDNGCTDTDEILVEVNVASANAGTDKTICLGESTQLGASGGISYSWSPVAGLSDADINSPTASPTTTTDYTVTATDNNGCIDTDLVRITVNPVPILTASADQNICKGSTANLSASGANTYSWSPSAGLSNASISNPIASPSSTTVYTVTGVGINSCAQTEEVIVFVNDLPDVDAGEDSEVCSGSSVSLNGNATGSDPFTYSWSPTTGLNNAAIASPIVSTTVNRTYTLTVTDNNGCTASDEVLVRVNTAQANAGTNVSICLGESIQLGASGGVSYLWSPAIRLNDISTPSPLADPTSTTTYSVTVTDNNGCTATDMVTVTVNDIPTVTTVSDQTICKGGSTNLTTTGASTYSWSPTTGLNNGSIASPVASPTVTTVYTVTGTNSLGCSVSEQVIVFVNELPEADAGNDIEVCGGTNMILNASASGTSPFTYSWLPTTGIVVNSTTATPTINVTDDIVYTFTVTDANGCSDSDQIRIETGGAVANAGADKTICQGEQVTLSASGGVSYAWSPATGLDNTNSSSPIATPTATTTYTVTITNGEGCVDSDDVTINVLSVPILMASADQTICKGSNVTVSASGATTYKWQPTTGLNNASIPNPIASPTVTTVYTVTGTNGVGCEDTKQVIVYVNDLPLADAGNDFEVCSGVDFSMDGTSSGFGPFTYGWSPTTGIVSGANTLTPSINLSSNQTYILTVTDGNGCLDTDQIRVTVNSANANAGLDKSICVGERIQLIASGGVSYSWSPTAGLSDATTSSPIASPASTTSYTVTVTNNDGCISSDVVAVNVSDVPALTASANQTICKGESINLSASGAVSYSWSPSIGLNNSNVSTPIANPTVTTIYSVTGTNSNDCSTSKDVIVFVNELPIPDVGNDFEVCGGNDYVINGSVSGIGPFTYTWTPSTGIVSNGSTAAPTINVTSDVVYTLTVTDANGCVASDDVSVTSNGAVANAGSDETICLGESIQLSGSGGNSYSWSPAVGLSNTNIPNPLASPVLTTTYTLTISDGDGCVATDDVTISVDGVPTLTVAADQIICKGDGVQISASGANSYIWSPSIGLNNANVPNPLASPSVTTIYTVTATNNQGCSANDQVIVTVNETPVADAGNDFEVCQGSNVVMIGTASGSGSFSYSWTPLTGIVSGENTATPTINLSTNKIYQFTVTDANGCVDTDAVEVDVNFASANAGNDETICEGGSVNLSATGGISYSWSPSAGLNNASISSPVASPSIPTTYTVTVTDNTGCTDTDQVVVNVDTTPSVIASGDQTICKGSSVTLTATGATSYTWSPSVGLNNVNVANPIASPTVTTIYTVTGNEPSGCGSTDQVIVYVNDLPELDVGSDFALCNGEIGNLTGLASGNGPFNYSWSPMTGIISGANAASAQISLSSTTEYTLTVTDTNGCQALDRVEVRVDELPSPFITVDDLVTSSVDVCMGQAVQLEANGGVSYIWSPSTGLSASNIRDPLANVSGSETYKVVVTNATGCIDSVEVVINAVSNPVVNAGTILQLCIDNEPYDLRQDVNIQGGVFSGTGVDGNGILFNPTDAGVGTHFIAYDVAVSGCSGATTREIEVLPLPAISAGSDVELCLGDSTELFGSGGVYYGWSPATGLNKTMGSVVKASPAIPTTYTLRGLDANGCENVDYIFVDVRDFSASAGSNVVICEGESIQLNGSSSGAVNFVWSPASGLNDDGIEDPVASPLVTTTYLLTTVNSQGCEATDEVIVTVEAQPSLIVGTALKLCQNEDPFDLRSDVNIGGGSFSSSSSALSGVLFDPSEDNPGIYFVDYAITVGNCNLISQREVEIYAPPIVTLNRTDLNICEGESFQFLASGGIGYEWFPDDHLSDPNVANPVLTANEDLTYTVRIIDFKGCQSAISVNVKVEVPDVDAGINVTICQGEHIELDASGAVSYSWSPTTGLDNVNAPNPIANPNNTTEYTVTGITAEGCTMEDKVLVTVKDLPPLYAGVKLILCQGSPVYDLRNDVNIGGGVFSSESDGLIGVLFNPALVDVGIYFISYEVQLDGCTIRATREIEIQQIPTIIGSDEYEVCHGEGVQLLVSGGTSYSWTPTSNISNPNVYNPIVTPDANTIYTVTVGDASGCTNSKDVLVMVNQPNASAGSDVTICQGESIRLIGSGGSIYRWTPTTGLDDPNVKEPFASPAITTSYTVTVTDNNGCTGTDKVTVTVDAAPFLDPGSKLIFCFDDAVYDLRQDVNITGGVFSSQSSALNNVLFNPQLENPGIYFVDYTVNVNNCVTTATREIEIKPEPSGSVLTDNYTLCRGSNVQFSASGGVTYRWEPPIYLDNPNTYNPNIIPGTDVDYTVFITDLFGCVTERSVSVTVDDITAHAGIDQTICEGESVELQGSGGSIYSWTPATGLSNASIDNPIAAPISTTTYTLTVRNAEGCESTDQVIITVNPAPSLDVGSKVILCVDDDPYDLRDDITVTGGIFSSVSGGLNGVLFDPSLVAKGIYFVEYSVDLNGCSVTKTREIEVKGQPTVSFDQSGYEICQGEAIEVNVTGGTSYEWFPKVNISNPFSSSTTFNPTTTRVYELEVTNDFGCSSRKQVVIVVNNIETTLSEDLTICQGEAVELMATGGVSYGWDFEPSLSNINIDNPIATPINTTTYKVRIVNINGCEKYDSLTVTVDTPPVLSVGTALTLCKDDEPYDLRADVNISEGVFSSSSNGLNDVLFDASEVSAGIYFVTYRVNNNSCEVSETREVRVRQLPIAAVADDDITLCQGESVQLSASGGVTYRWEPSIYLNNANIFNPLATVTNDVTYTVYVTDSYGCIGNSQVSVTVDDISSSAGIDQTICEGESVELQGSGGSIYSWTPATGLSNASIDNPVAAPISTTTYTLTVRNAEGCESTDQVTITVNPAPDLFVGDVLILCQDSDPIDLREEVNIGGGIFSSESSGLQGVQYDPSKENEGIFFVDYTVTLNECTIKATREIQIKGQPTIRFDQTNYEICSGDDIQISVTGGASYEWFPKIFISDGYVNDPFLSPLTTSDYEVVVTDAFGCSASELVTIKVNDVTADAGNDLSICQGETLSLEAKGGIVYEWSGGAIDGFSTDKPDVTPAFTTIYSVRVISEEGCSDTDEITVFVNEPIDLNIGEELILCSSDDQAYDLRQDVNFQGGTFSSTSEGLSTVFFNPMAVSEGVYFVDYSIEIDNCAYEARREIEVREKPNAFPEFGDYEICEGEETRIIIRGEGEAYQWNATPFLNVLNGHEVIASPTESTIFAVEVTDAVGCVQVLNVPVTVNRAMADAGVDITICAGDNVQLSATGGISYEWVSGEVSDPHIANPFTSPSVNSLYTVQITTAEGCTDTDEVFVQVIQSIDLEIGDNLILCQSDLSPYDLRTDVSHSGGTFTSQNDGLNGVFFRPSTVEPGIYFVTYDLDISDCLYSDTREIEVQGEPTVFFEFENYEVCRGDSVHLQLIGSGTLSYEWRFNNTINDLTTAAPFVSPLVNTTYFVDVYNELGCFVTKQIDVHVNAISGDAGRNLTICYGETIQLDASGGDFYEWGFSPSLTGRFENNPEVSPLETTMYYVTINDDNGCQVSDSVEISVTPPLDLEVGDKLYLCYDAIEGYDLRNDVSIAGGTFNSVSSGLDNVRFVPSRSEGPGVYFVNYTIQNGGCPFTVTREIEVLDGPVLLVPDDGFSGCLGSDIPIELQSSSFDSVSWSPQVGLSNAHVLNPVVNSDKSRTYSVTMFNTYGCSTTAEIYVEINNNQLPSLPAQSLCVGDPFLELEEVYEGDWNGSFVTGNRFLAEEPGEYYLQVLSSDGEGCIGADSMRVNVSAIPTITFKDTSRVDLCLNDDIIDLNEYIVESGITWESPNTTEAGLFDPQGNGAGTFVVDLMRNNQFNCTIEGTMTVKVNRPPSVDAGPSVEVCLEADTIDIGRLALPAGGSFFGPGIYDNSFFIPTAASEGRHEISYSYTDPVTGCLGISSRIIEVLAPSLVFAGSPLSVCIDSDPIDLSLSVNPTGGSFFASSGVNGTSFYPSSGVGEYEIIYTITDNNQCQSSARRVITVNQRPELIISPAEITRCRNAGLIDLNSFVNIPGGKWGGTKGIVNGLVTADSVAEGTTILSYTVSTSDGCDLVGQLILSMEEIELADIGEDLNTCLGGDAINLLEGFNREFMKVTGEGVSTDGVFEPWIVDRGTHKVTYEFTNRNGCIAIQSKTIIVQGEVFVDAGNDLTVCRNIGTINLQDTGIPQGGVWSGNFVGLNTFDAQAAAIGTHELYYTVDLGLGCINTDTLIIEVESSNISDFGKDTIVCINSTELLLNFNEELKNGKWTGRGVVNNTFYPAQSGPGTWVLNYENSNFDCEIAGQRQIVVIALPDKAITGNYNISGCIGDVIRLSADVLLPDQSTHVEYEWYRENDDRPFAIGKTVDYQIIGNENIYFNTVNQFGCKPNEVDFIRVTANGPVGDFEVSKDSVELGELVQFTPFSSNVDDFLWSYGDGNANNDEIAYYYYYSTGWHTVSLTLTSSDGCSYTIVKENAIYVRSGNERENNEVLSIKRNKMNVSIYPIPVKSDLNITMNEGFTGKLSILSLDGDLIDQRKTGEQMTINLEEHAEGIYFFVINAEDGTTYSKRIILTK